MMGVTSVWFTGCAGVGKRPNDSAAYSLRRAAAEVQYEQRTLDLAMGTLKDLVTDPGADLKLPFRQYNLAVNRLIAAANATQRTGQRMSQQNAAYLREWDKQSQAIEYEHIRNVSLDRRTEVSNRFSVIDQRYQQSQAVVQPLVSYLMDIRRALSTDLTAEGLTAIKPIAANAEQNSAKVQTALAALNNELADSSSRLSSINFQNAATPAGQRRADVAIP